MFDFDVLEARETGPGRSPEPAVGEEGSLEAERRSVELREAVRSKLKGREPPLHILRRWDQCEEANDLIRHFVLEGATGESESIRFRDVLELLDALKWSTTEFVFFFLGDGDATEETQEVARDILRALAGMDRDNGDGMRFRGVYRLLEVLGIDIETLLQTLGEVDYKEDREPHNTLTFGNFRLLKGIGSGFNGMCVYRGEHVGTGRRVAVKWPVGTQELEILKDIQRQSVPLFLGLPELLANGTYGGKLYMVTELLGSPLAKVFERLERRPVEQCWRVVRAVGRLVLRRLEALHGCGYVHCDVSPENILLGLPRTVRGSKAQVPLPGALTPYLIDFGLAQPFPNGQPLDADHGSAEWSSVRSALGSRRRPEDDLEALGWLMVNGLFGPLPWFEVLSNAYKTWDTSRSARARAIRKAQEAKLQLLNEGWDSLGQEWCRLARIPPSLDRYIQSCRSDRATGMSPDYAHLSGLLGAREGFSLFEAEQHDLTVFRDALDHLP